MGGKNMMRGICNVLTRCLPIGLVLLLAAPPFPRVQAATTPPPLFKPGQLEQIVAPIALYPDSLVAHILMASTYPLEVIQAARFVKANPGLRDADLDEELTKRDWDDSVKALVRFPQVLEMMDSQLEWMQRLGDAVLAQQKDTLAAIQRLRARALRAGTLKSNEQQKVIVEGTPPETTIRIDPVNPEIVYVPTYDPNVIFGDWPYPAYPPYAYYPPYSVIGYPEITFGFGMLVGGAIWAGCNWRLGHIFVRVDHHDHFHRQVNRGLKVNPLLVDRRGGPPGRALWQHNPEHRKAAPGRDLAIQQKVDRPGGGGAIASREPLRGHDGGVGMPGGSGGGRPFDGKGLGEGQRLVNGGNVSVGTFPSGGNVGVSMFPSGGTISASTFPSGGTMSASTFPSGGNMSASTFPGGGNMSASTFPGGNFNGNIFPGTGFSSGGMRGGGWGRR
jgi:hypothetical protein